MRKHHGAHPRSGATDVLPLIPVAGITLEECAALARVLAQRLWEELGIPSKFYCLWDANTLDFMYYETTWYAHGFLEGMLTGKKRR